MTLEQMREWERRLVALENCLHKLPSRDRRFIAMRYQLQLSVQDIAHKCKKTPNAISHVLFRIRAALAECVERALAMEQTG